MFWIFCRKFATKTFLRGGKKSSKIARKDKYVLPTGGARPPLHSSTMTKEDSLTASMDSIQSDSRPSSIMFDEDELSSKSRNVLCIN